MDGYEKAVWSRFGWSFKLAGVILLVVLIMALVEQCNGQEFPQPFEYRYVDSTVIGSKSELFSKAKQWVAYEFKCAKDVIQLSDDQAGKIIVKGSFKYAGPGYYIEFTCTIDIKDNKTRIIAGNYAYQYAASEYNVAGSYSLEPEISPGKGLFKVPQKFYNKLKMSAYTQTNDMVNDFVHYMRGSDAKKIDDGF